MNLINKCCRVVLCTQMGHVYYHHPGDKQFSFDFVHPNPAEIVSQIVGYDDDEVAVKVQRYDIDEAFYIVYTSRVGGGPVREIDFDLKASLAEMSEDNSTITVRLLEIYRALIAQNIIDGFATSFRAHV